MPVADLVPIVVEAVEAIGVVHRPGRGEVQGTEFQGQHLVPVAQHDPFAEVGRPVQDDAAVLGQARPQRAVGQLQVGDHHPRTVAAVADLVGTEDGQAVDAAEVHAPAGAAAAGLGVELVVLKPVADVVVVEGAGVGGEAAEAEVGADPQAAVVVLEHAVDGGVGQAVPHAEAFEVVVLLVVAVQPVGGPDPDLPAAVLGEADHDVAGGAARVSGVVLPGGELAAAGIEALQALGPGSDPDAAAAVGAHRAQGRLAPADPGRQVGHEDVAFPVVVVQAAHGRQPEGAVAVLAQAEDARVAQAAAGVGAGPVVDEAVPAAVVPAQAAAVRRHPEPPVGILVNRRQSVGADRRAVGLVVQVDLHLVPARHDPVQAAVGADPDLPEAVLAHGPDRRLAEAALGRLARPHVQEALGVEVQQVGAVLAGDPEHARAVDGEVAQAVRAEAVGHQGIVADVPAAAGAGLQQVQPAVHGGDPEPSRGVLGDAADRGLGQGVGIGGIVPVMAEAVGLRFVEIQALGGPHPEPAGPIHVQTVDHVVDQAAGVVVGVGPALDQARGRIDAAEAAAGPGPDAPVRGLGHAPDLVRGQPRRRVGIVPPGGDGGVGGVEAQQAVLAGGQPDPVLRVDRQVLHLVGLEAGRGRRIPAEVHEPFLPRVEVAEAGALGPVPDAPLAVLGQAPQAVAADAGRIVGVVLEDADAMPVVAVQAVLGGQPDEPFPVLQHLVDDTLGQPVPGGDAAEAGRILQGGGRPRGRQQDKQGQPGGAGHASEHGHSRFRARPGGPVARPQGGRRFAHRGWTVAP